MGLSGTAALSCEGSVRDRRGLQRTPGEHGLATIWRQRSGFAALSAALSGCSAFVRSEAANRQSWTDWELFTHWRLWPRDHCAAES